MQHSKPLFAFDWDDVIADREQIRDAVRDLFLLAGVPRAFEEVTYDYAKRQGGYHFKAQLRAVLRQYPYLVPTAPVLQRTFEESLKRLSNVVYPDAERFITHLYGRFPIAIVTTGDTDFQQRKVAQAGLARYADHMIFVQHRNESIGEDKSRVLGQLLEMYPKIFFFEDRPMIIKQVHDEHSKHGRVIPIRVDRKLESTIKYPNIIRHFDEFDLSRWIGDEV
jgi:phosphoglycolate phosphatase-like HAD superfamily hydrolase